MAFEIFITVFCLKKFDNCIDMCYVYLAWFLVILLNLLKVFTKFGKIVAIISSNDFSAFCCHSSVWYFPTVYYGSDFFLFCFCSFIAVLYFDPSYCSLQVPWFFSFTECNLLLRISSEFFISDIAFFMSRSSIWILHHLFFSWLCCGFL